MYLAQSQHIRAADQYMMQDLALPGILLMEAAAQGIARFIRQHYPAPRPVLIACGPGNNGGDGLAVARLLHLAGYEVQVLLAQPTDALTGDPAAYAAHLQAIGLPIAEHGTNPGWTDWQTRPDALLVDALLGTGAKGPLRGSIAEVVSSLQAWQGPTVAVDLPTGLDADSGSLPQEQAPLQAAHTLALALPKVAHYVTPAAGYCGRVHVQDIGMDPASLASQFFPCQLMTDTAFAERMSPRPAAAHKGDYGHVLVVGGQTGMPGAPTLAAKAALHAGAGKITALVPSAARSVLHSQLPEAMSINPGEGSVAHLTKDALPYLPNLAGYTLAIGPGMGTAKPTAALLKQLLKKAAQPPVLDADALNLIAEQPELLKHLPASRGDALGGGRAVLTPHPGEMARLLGITTQEVQAHRLELALQFAEAQDVVLLLKGQGTVVAAPDGRAWVIEAGSPGMATGGTGDVLTGMVAAYLAKGHAPLEAAALAAHLHGRAGQAAGAQTGEEALAASDVIAALGPTYVKLATNGVSL